MYNTTLVKLYTKMGDGKGATMGKVQRKVRLEETMGFVTQATWQERKFGHNRVVIALYYACLSLQSCACSIHADNIIKFFILRTYIRT